MILILLILTLLILTIVLSIIYLESLQEQKFYEPFIYETESLNLEEFRGFYHHQANLTKSKTKDKYDGAGVYVIYNRTEDKYHIGQGDLVIEEIHQQFEGEKNKDLQSEVNKGDQFFIKMMLLDETDCQTLDELEDITRSEFVSEWPISVASD